MATRPDSANELITSQTKGKLPAFFKYAKDKTDSQCEKPTKSTMNRIMAHIPDARIKYSKSIGQLDWRVLINQNEDYSVRENHPVIESYNYWIKHQFRFSYGEDEHINEDDLYKYRRIREEILKTEYNLDFIVNSLVAYAYTVKKDSNKKLLWACFGNEIVDNIKANVTGRICPICGKRFEPNVHNQICCCEKCAHDLDVQKKRENREKITLR